MQYLTKTHVSMKHVAIKPFAAVFCITLLLAAVFSCQKKDIPAQAPVINQFTPPESAPGGIVVISGMSFASNPAGNEVSFNGISARVTDATANELTVEVPQGAASGPLTVRVNGQSVQSLASFTLNPHAHFIRSISPDRGDTGTLVTIAGRHFCEDSKVYFGGVQANDVIIAGDSCSITARVPAGAVTGRVKVVTGHIVAVSRQVFWVKPVISSVTPGSSWQGKIIEINGVNFSDCAADDSVRIGNTWAAAIIEASKTKLRVLVPAGAQTGKVYVRVKGLEAESPAVLTITPVAWQKLLGGTGSDWANAVVATPDGGYVMAGATTSNNGDASGFHGGYSDIWVVKINAAHEVVWQKTVGGSGEEEARGLSLTADGGILVTGFTTSNNGDITGNHGDYDMVVLKLDANGNTQWLKVMGGTGWEMGDAVQGTPDGGCMIASFTGSINNGDVTSTRHPDDVWVVRMDASGNIIWQNTFGGSSTDQPHSLVLTPDGGCIVTGWTESADGDVTGFHGTQDIWLIRVSATGSLVWQKTVGGPYTEEGFVVKATPDGNYILGGDGETVLTPEQTPDAVYVMKFNGDGDILWQHLYGTGSPWYIYGCSVAVAPDGSIMAGGYFNNMDDSPDTYLGANTYVARIDASGNKLWDRILGGSGDEYPSAIIPATDGGFLVAGSTSSNNNGDVGPSHGGTDMWVYKLWE